VDAFLSWRKTMVKDLPASLNLHPAKNGAERIGYVRALKAWRQLLTMTHTSRSAVVELHGKGKSEIVGFGFAAFVKKGFADAELLSPSPGLNCRIIESIDRGNAVTATYEEVRCANTKGDLEQVILETSWKSDLNAARVDEVRVLLAVAYQNLHAGYRFSRILTEVVDELDMWHLRGEQVVRMVDRFEAYRAANPTTTWNSDRALGMVTCETIRHHPHCIAAALFQHQYEPQFAFTWREQELLEAAMAGLDDSAAAEVLFVSVAAIKRRWAQIFERVSAIAPAICPSDANGSRGLQKRQRVLSYVRSHPEELRPFEFKSKK
jgi:hypothetical protein